MPNFTSPAGTSHVSIPLFNSAMLGRAAGLSVTFASIAALNAAVTEERARIVLGLPTWVAGEQLAIASEAAQGVSRVWSVAAQHARTAVLAAGVVTVLAADTNVVLFGSGVPAAGTGAVGDVLVDGATGLFYTKIGAAVWGAPAAISVSGGSASTASPAFTGTPTAPTAAAGANTTQLATTEFATTADAVLAASIALRAPTANPTFTGTVSGVSATMVGLSNVDNTSDASKPVSTAAATALSAKAPTANPTFIGVVTGVTAAMVGLAAVDNTSDANKPVSTAASAALSLKAPLASPTFTGTVAGVTSAMVGLGNVDNTSDANKPVSTAAATALGLKADLSGGKLLASQLPDLAISDYLGSVASQAAMLALVGQRGDWCTRSDTGTNFVLNSDTPSVIGSWTQLTYPSGASTNLSNTPSATDVVVGSSSGTGTTLPAATSSAAGVMSAAQVVTLASRAPLASPTFTGTVAGVTAAMVGLANVDNTSDANKPVSTAAGAALALKAPLASPTFTGTVAGVTAAMVGLGSVDNTSDANKPVSTAQTTALGLKADLASPTLTGVPAAPTAALNTSTTQLATTAFVAAAAALKQSLNTRVDIANQTVSATLTAATTVDITGVECLAITQTTASVTITLPSPTVATLHKALTVENVGSVAVTVAGADSFALNVGESRQWRWNGTTWKMVGTLTAAQTTSVQGLVAGTLSETSPYVTMTATGNAFTGACVLAGWYCSVAVGNITVYDALSATGTPIVSATALTVGPLPILGAGTTGKLVLTTGLHVVLSGAATVRMLVA